jgi:hypothetical protein
VIETFSHATQISLCASATQSMPISNKLFVRRSTLTDQVNYYISQLSNIDFIDAAFCTVAADFCAKNQFTAYGCAAEGFIVIPNKSA